MKIQKKYPILIFAMLMCALLVSACSQPTVGSTTGGSNLSVADVLQKSATAMKDLKTAHIDLKLTNNTQATGAVTTATTNAAAGTPVPTSVNVALSGSGDQIFPDQQHMDLNVTALNQSNKVSEIVQGDKVYVKSPDGKWYVLNKSDYENTITTNPFSGITFDQNTLLGLLQHIKVVDHSDEKVNGQNLRHITADLDKEALKQLLTNTPQLKSVIGQQNIDTLLASTKSLQSSLDVWIDETQFYVHRTQFKLDLTADTTAATNGGSSSIISTKLDTTVDLSKFNVPVTITAPTNATPINNVAGILTGR